MKYLLDSHILIWALFADEKLPHEVYAIINAPENEIYYSAVSVWEIGIKHSKSPGKMPISSRLLVEGMIFLTHDHLLKDYGEDCVRTL